MQKLNEIEMASFQGGRNDVDCGVTAAFAVVGGALGLLLVTGTAGLGAVAMGSFGVGYLASMYGTLKACDLV